MELPSLLIKGSFLGRLTGKRPSKDSVVFYCTKNQSSPELDLAILLREHYTSLSWLRLLPGENWHITSYLGKAYCYFKRGKMSAGSDISPWAAREPRKPSALASQRATSYAPLGKPWLTPALQERDYSILIMPTDNNLAFTRLMHTLLKHCGGGMRAESINEELLAAWEL